MKRTDSALRWLASTSVLLTVSLAQANTRGFVNNNTSSDTVNRGVDNHTSDVGFTLPLGKDERGCPVVPLTAEDCRTMAPRPDGGSPEPCFVNQLGVSGSLCAEVLKDDAVVLAENHERMVVASPLGMEGDLREAFAVPPIASFAPGKPDPASYTSMRNDELIRLAAGQVMDGDRVRSWQWDNNGNRINSCREYVYEKYYEYSRFQEEIAKRATTYRDYFNIAFEHSANPWAIGSRHLDPNDPLRYRSKDGQTLSRGADIFRTRKHFIPIDIATKTLDIPPLRIFV